MLQFRLLAGCFLILLGLGYLFYPKLIIRMNAFMRDNVFNDRLVLLDSKRMGCILVLVGLILCILTYRLR